MIWSNWVIKKGFGYSYSGKKRVYYCGWRRNKSRVIESSEVV